MLQIITNHQPRNLLYWYELTPAERTELDYYSDEEMEGLDFFRYKGQIYDPREFFTVSEYQEQPFSNWHGYQSDSFFSGILIRYSDDMEQVIIGTYIC